MTILHLTHEGHGAGSSISIALLARAQRAAGHRVLVGCPGGSFLARHAAAAGAEIVPLDFASIGEAARAVRRVVDAEAVDVVNAHASRDRAACRRARLAGARRAAFVMTRRSMPHSTPLSALADRWLADAVIAVSAPVAAALRRRGIGAARLFVVPNAVDLARLDRAVAPDEVAAARRLAAEGRVAGPADLLAAPRVVLGVVARRKEQVLLLEALTRVAAPVTLICLGIRADPALAAAAARAAARGHAVACIPFQDDPRPFYDLFDVCVLPTREEGLSQALLEAMALGKAVIATAAGGNLALVRDGGDGLLVPPGAAAALGTAVARLAADGALRARLGAAARGRVRAEFTIARTLEATAAVYAAALARRNGRVS